MPKIDPRRVDDAEERWVALEPVRQIERALMTTYGVCRRQAQRYISLARKRIVASEQQVAPEERAAQIDAMFMQAFEAAQIANKLTGQPNAAAMVTAAHRRAEMLGLMAPQKLKLDASVNGVGDILAKAFDSGPGEAGEGPVDK
jgi:hypothetical protein